MLLSKTRKLIQKIFISSVARQSAKKHQTLSYPADDYDPDDVIAQEFGDKGLITLNKPEILNPLSRSMATNMLSVMKKWKSSKKVVVVKGAGGKSFCAGGEIKNYSRFLATAEYHERSNYIFNPVHNELINHIEAFENSYVALISGIVIGRGAGISVHGKYRVATETTMFAMPETSIGLFPNAGGTYFLPRLNGNLGLYLGLTGHRLKGLDVKLAGFATHYVSSSKLPELTEALVAPGDVNVEEILERFEEKIPAAKFSLDKYSEQIDKCFSGNTIDEILDRLKEDGSEWAQGVIRTLGKMSPTALKVTIEALKRGKKMKSLSECLDMELNLEHNLCVSQNCDFVEGVRALIIDKDYKPSWNPRTLDEVTDEYVQKYFNSRVKLGHKSKL